MNVKEWEKQREKDIEKGSYYIVATEPIQINMTEKEIKDIIDKYNLEELKNDLPKLWLTLDNLKSDIYLKKLDNKPKNIRSWLFERNNELKKMFPKFFWAEYVANEMYERNYTFEDMINYCGVMGDLYEFLKKHSKYHGCSGEKYQETGLREYVEKLTGMTFSWRSWGALMSAFMNSKEKKRKYHYINFYINEGD